MQGLLVLGLLMEQVPGKSRALQANSSEFTFLFCCVTLSKLPKLSVLVSQRAVFRRCFNAESYVPGTLCFGFMQVISWSPPQSVLLLSLFYRSGHFRRGPAPSERQSPSCSQWCMQSRSRGLAP